MAICDNCKGSFSLLHTDFCKTCPERPDCFQFPNIDLLAILVEEKVLRIDASGYRQILCKS